MHDLRIARLEDRVRRLVLALAAATVTAIALGVVAIVLATRTPTSLENGVVRIGTYGIRVVDEKNFVSIGPEMIGIGHHEGEETVGSYLGLYPDTVRLSGKKGSDPLGMMTSTRLFFEREGVHHTVFPPLVEQRVDEDRK